MLIIILLLLLLLSIVGALSSKSLLSPEFISPFCWVVILFLYKFLNHGLYDLSDKVLLIILLWNVSLVAGVFFAKLLVSANNKNSLKEKSKYFKNKSLSYKISDLYYKITIIGFFPTLYITYKQTQSIGGDFFYSLRMANTGIVETDISLGIFSYTYAFAYIAFFSEFILMKKGGAKKRFIILLIINLILAFVTVSKSAFLFLIIPTLVIYLIKNKQVLPNLKVLKYIFLTFILMISIHSMRESGSSNKTEGSVVLYTYLLGGLPALDEIVNSEMVSAQPGQHTLSLIINIQRKLGFKEVISKKYTNDITYDSYLYIPYPTNVYTAIGPIWLDFKYYGIILLSFFIGLLVGYFYLKSIKYDWALIVYGYLFSVLILQFFGEYIFTNMSLLLQIVLLSYVLYFFSNRRIVWR